MKGPEEQRDELARLAAHAVDPERVVALARDLVRIRSVFEPGVPGSNEAEAAEFLAKTLRASGFRVTVEEAAPGRPNVIADWQGSSFLPTTGRTLMFEGHTDVVTEGDPDSWSYPPFAGEIVEGRLYGRGSADMKAGIAAAVAATEAVARATPWLNGRIRLGIVADEEGSMLGIKNFIDRGWAKGVDGAIICEPEENELCLYQKGAMRVGVTFRGVMSHGAMPYSGVNPIPPLAKFVLGVAQIESEEQERVGEHPFLGRPWFTPTLLRAPREGEQQLNVVPETAYLALDIRTVPGQDHDHLQMRLSQLTERIQAEEESARIEIELIEERPWTETADGEPLVAALERAYRTVLCVDAKYGGVPGATDGTFLHARAGIPIVTVGPGDRTIPHQRDEFVEIEALITAARLYAAAAVEFLLGERDGGPDSSKLEGR
ncbi:MAG: M20 family metallopeptidase [Trueperaceae bacterium]